MRGQEFIIGLVPMHVGYIWSVSMSVWYIQVIIDVS